MNESETASTSAPDVAEHVAHTVPPAVTPPAPSVAPGALPDVGALLSDSLSFAWARLDIVGWYILMQIVVTIPILVAFGGMAMVGSFMPSWFDDAGIAFVAIGICALVALIVLMTLSYGAVLYAVTVPERVTFWDGWRWAFKHFWALVWVNIAASLVFMAGLVFFIIPGIIIAVYTGLYVAVLVREDVRGIPALVRSTELIKDHWWGVFGRIILIFIVAIVLAMLGALTALMLGLPLGGSASGWAEIIQMPFDTVIGSFTTVFMTHAVALMYGSLAAQRPAGMPTTLPSLRTWYVVLTVVGGLLFMLVPLIAITSLGGSRAVAEDATVKTSLSRLSVEAELYAFEASVASYAGFCDTGVVTSTAVSGEVVCNDSPEAYAISAELSTGDYWCVDSNGTTETRYVPLGNDTECAPFTGIPLDRIERTGMPVPGINNN